MAGGLSCHLVEQIPGVADSAASSLPSACAQEAVHQTGLPFPEDVYDLIIKSGLPW